MSANGTPSNAVPFRTADQRLAHRLNAVWAPCDAIARLSARTPPPLELPPRPPGRYATVKALNRLHLEFTPTVEAQASSTNLPHRQVRNGWTLWLFRGTNPARNPTVRTLKNNDGYVMGTGGVSPQDALDRAVQRVLGDPLNWGGDLAVQRLEALIRQALVLVEGELLRSMAHVARTPATPRPRALRPRL